MLERSTPRSETGSMRRQVRQPRRPDLAARGCSKGAFETTGEGRGRRGGVPPFRSSLSAFPARSAKVPDNGK